MPPPLGTAPVAVRVLAIEAHRRASRWPPEPATGARGLPVRSAVVGFRGVRVSAVAAQEGCGNVG